MFLKISNFKGYGTNLFYGPYSYFWLAYGIYSYNYTIVCCITGLSKSLNRFAYKVHNMVIQYVNWMYLVECSLNLTFWQFYYPADDKCRWKHQNERTNFWYETYSDKVNRQISRLMYKNIWKFILILYKWYCLEVREALTLW